MRLFIAIRLSRELRQAVQDVQNAFRRQGIRGRYSPEENLHITLAFIGEYNDPDEILKLMEQIRFRPFTITLDKIGCFDDLWWAGVGENPELETLFKNVRHILADADVPYDRKRYRPHITFLRNAVPVMGRIRPEQIRQRSMTVRRISLMLSTTGKNGSIYTELGSIAARL